MSAAASKKRPCGGALGVEPRSRDEAETKRLIALATLIVRARSAVERDGYSREIELVPGSEAPTRFVIVLDRLLPGLDVIGLDREAAWRVVTKVGLDSVPALRMALLRALEAVDIADTNAPASAVRHPASTTRRAVEDLTAHGLVELHRKEKGEAHEWSLSSFSRSRLGSFPLNHGLSRNVVEHGERENKSVLTSRERVADADAIDEIERLTDVKTPAQQTIDVRPEGWALEDEIERLADVA